MVDLGIEGALCQSQSSFLIAPAIPAIQTLEGEGQIFGPHIVVSESQLESAHTQVKSDFTKRIDRLPIGGSCEV